MHETQQVSAALARVGVAFGGVKARVWRPNRAIFPPANSGIGSNFLFEFGVLRSATFAASLRKSHDVGADLDGFIGAVLAENVCVRHRSLAKINVKIGVRAQKLH